MRYSFTGTTNPTTGLIRVLHHDIETLTDGTEFTTGLAEGIDTQAMLQSHKHWPNAHHRVVVPRGNHNQKALEYAKKHGFTIEIAPHTTHPYRPRNELLVAHCDILRAYPEGPENEHPRSGTWMTIRIARKQRKGIMVGWLSAPAADDPTHHTT